MNNKSNFESSSVHVVLQIPLIIKETITGTAVVNLFIFPGETGLEMDVDVSEIEELKFFGKTYNGKQEKDFLSKNLLALGIDLEDAINDELDPILNSLNVHDILSIHLKKYSELADQYLQNKENELHY